MSAESVATVSRYRWTILGAATFAQAGACFFVQGIGSLSIQLERALHLNTFQIGLLVSAAQLVPLVGLLLAGELLDRYGERWVVAVGTALVAAALLAGSQASGYGALLVALLVVGAGYSTAQPGGSKSVATWFPPTQRGFAMGIRQAGLPLGGALAAAVLPWLAAVAGWRSAVAAGGAAALLACVVFAALYRRPAGTEPDLPPAPAHSRQPLTPRAPRTSPWSALAERMRMLREPAMVRIVLSGVSLHAVQDAIVVLCALSLHERQQLSGAQAAMVLFAAQAAGALGRIVLAAWSDRLRSGRYRAVLVCLGAVAAGLVLLGTPLGASPTVAAGVFVWLGFFGFGWYGPWVAYVTESAPAARTGFALGLAMAVNQIVVIAVPPLLGFARDATGSHLLSWWALAFFAAGAGVVTLRTVPRRRKPLMPSAP